MEKISETTENYIDVTETNLRKKRKKSSYTKINNDTRLRLLEMVFFNIILGLCSKLSFERSREDIKS